LLNHPSNFSQIRQFYAEMRRKWSIDTMDSDSSQSPPLILIGASVRAATESAVKAGFAVHAIDWFGDRDLQAIAASTTIAQSDQQIVAALHRLPKAPIVYTGALENSPELIELLSRHGQLAGNDCAAVSAVRDIEQVHQLLNQYQIAYPSTAVDPQRLVPPLVRKPRRSAAGQRMIQIDSLDDNKFETRRGTYPKNSIASEEKEYIYQEWIAGDSYGASFIAGPLETKLLGVCRQIIGDKSLGARPFAYCGSVGPLTLPTSETKRLEMIGRAVAQEFGLIGSCWKLTRDTRLRWN
jgi:uncharacterized protein